MEIITLEHTPIDKIVEAFNKAFADYQVKIKLTEETLLQKIATENICLRYSVGAFIYGQLVGFILHAYDEIDGQRVIYNGGTGVLPSHRGKGISEKLYQFLIPRLKEEGIQRCFLEVIDSNSKAIHVYLKTGFEVLRDLLCFRGIIYTQQYPDIDNIEVHELYDLNFEDLPEFWNSNPTWQNSNAAMRRATQIYRTVGLYKNDLLVGYGMVNPDSGRIAQFGVHPKHRRQGLGSALFDYMSKMGSSNLSIINVDKADEATTRFLNKVGLKSFIGQYEMVLHL